MRTLLLLAALAGIGAYAAYHYLHRPPVAQAAASLPAEPPPRALSLEERAAAAQGTRYPEQRPDPPPRYAVEAGGATAGSAPAQPTGGFRCDGRQRCPQMHSCEEARWFLRNCPNTKMDGDNDGVPCEDQWCREQGG